MKTNPMENKTLADIIELLVMSDSGFMLKDFRFAMVHNLFKYKGYGNRLHRYMLAFKYRENNVDFEETFCVKEVIVWLGESGCLEAAVNPHSLLELKDLSAFKEGFQNL